MKKSPRKLLAGIATLVMSAVILGTFAGCGQHGEPGLTGAINVTSREDGSGTRSAFVELFGIEEKQEDGSKLDRTKPDACITNSTAVMLLNVSGDPHGLGYISLGALNNSVKALHIDGAEPTAENIKNGSYTVARPFNIVTQADLTPQAQDFIHFILSAEGQKIVEEENYVAVSESLPSYQSSNPQGKIVVVGSSSVAPVMEALKEAYEEQNPDVSVELQTNDSTTGVNATIDGICDIGMASRNLKDTELEAGISTTCIALDGVVVITNHENTIDNLSKEQVESIFVGEATDWSHLSV